MTCESLCDAGSGGTANLENVAGKDCNVHPMQTLPSSCLPEIPPASTSTGGNPASARRLLEMETYSLQERKLLGEAAGSCIYKKKKKTKKKFTDEIAVTVWDSAETRWFKRVTEILYFEKWHRSRQASSRAMPRQTTNIVRMPCIPHVLCTLYLYIHFTFYTYVQLLSFGSEACFVVVVCVCLRNLCVQSHVKCEWLSAIRP